MGLFSVEFLAGLLFCLSIVGISEIRHRLALRKLRKNADESLFIVRSKPVPK